MTDCLQEFILADSQLFENIGKKIRADFLRWMYGDCSSAAISVVVYGVAALLSNLGEAQLFQSGNNVP